MPPRVKKTDEEKEKDFEEWCRGPECGAIDAFNAELSKVKYDNGTVDIFDDWSEFLLKLWTMTQVLKVPGRKQKTPYEQKFIRTMFFENVETIKINDFFFEIPNSCKVDMSKCKEKLYEISVFFEGPWEGRSFNDYLQLKKDLMRELKAFDLLYVKHAKTTAKTMTEIHATAMSPLTNLLAANRNFHRLELMIAKGE